MLRTLGVPTQQLCGCYVHMSMCAQEHVCVWVCMSVCVHERMCAHEHVCAESPGHLQCPLSLKTQSLNLKQTTWVTGWPKSDFLHLP